MVDLESDEFFVEQVATMLCVDNHVIYNWIKSGLIKAEKKEASSLDVETPQYMQHFSLLSKSLMFGGAIYNRHLYQGLGTTY